MNEKKLNALLSAAQRETPIAAAGGFERLVMQQIQRDPARMELSISDVLNRWFPRLAVVAAAIIVLCAVGDYVSAGPTLSESAAQLSYPYFAEN
ncbi:MAG TPA: hypothetical protein VN873_05185 [Candidatus Angelobacter sp.]|nr:hypothetical protein [Candidatus Angelobacter sp.]